MKSKYITLPLIILSIIFCKLYIIDIARVDGYSMYPSLKNNQLVLFSKINKNYSRFDIVILKVDNKYYIKRVIGLPNERILYKEDKLYVNGKEIIEEFETSNVEDFELKEICPYDIIPKDKVLVLGDNRQDSYDSRNYGLVDFKDIKGKIILK